MRGLLQVGLVALPYLAFQYYAWQRYCVSVDLCLQSESEDCLSPHVWCSNSPPSVYSFIQGEYWENGFLRYWQFRKLPLFALAAPTVILAIAVAAKTVDDLSLSVIWSDLFGLRSAQAGLSWAGPPFQIAAWCDRDGKPAKIDIISYI